MSDYDNDFEIEEDVDTDDKPIMENKRTFITDKPSSKSRQESNRRVKPLNASRQSSNSNIGVQDYSYKPPVIKQRDAKSRENIESHGSYSSKPFGKPSRSRKYSEEEVFDSQVLEKENKRMGRKYNFDEESQNHVRESLSKPPISTKAMDNVSFQYEPPSNYEQMKDLITSNSGTKNEDELEEENKQLRQQLREMNTLLTKILDRQNVSNFAPKKITFVQKPVEDRLKTFNQEIQNNQKSLGLKLEEYHKLKERMEKVKGPSYILDIQDRINATHSKIEATRKEIKQLEWENKNSGKSLYNIENVSGLPATLVEANERARDLAVVQKKNDKLRADIDRFAESEQDQQKRLEDLQQQVSKFEAVAEHYKIPLEKNVHRQKYGNLAQEVKEYEDGIKFMLNRNDRYMENFFDRDLEELKMQNQRDRDHVIKLEDMIQEQSTALKDMLNKESNNGEKNMQELFSRLRVSLDENVSPAIDSSALGQKYAKGKKDDKAVKKPPLARVLNEREELLKDLPIYSPKRETAKPFNIKKDSKFTSKPFAKRDRSPEEKEKAWQEINDRYMKEEDLIKEKEKEEPKPDERFKKPDFKIKANKAESPQVETKEEVKPEPVEEKKPDVYEKPAFSKPFGLKKGKNTTTTVSNSTSALNNNTEEKPNTDQVRHTVEIEKKKDEPLASKYKDTPDMNYSHNKNPSITGFNSQRGMELKLPEPDSARSKKEEENPKPNGLVLQGGMNIGGNAFNSNIGNGKNPSQQELKLGGADPVKQESPAEDFGVPSRMNRGRMMKKEESPQGLVLNFGGGSGAAATNTTNTVNPLKLNNEVKVEGGIFTTQKTNPIAQPEIQDPFAKYDKLDEVDFSKKKSFGGLGGSSIRKMEDEGGIFGKEAQSEKKEEIKPFSLNTQQGPKRVLNMNPSGVQSQQPTPFGQQPATFGQQPSQPLNLNAGRQPQLQPTQPTPFGQQPSQPLNLNAGRQPQLRLGGDSGGAGIWNKKSDDNEIKTIGESNPKPNSIWDKGDSNSGGGLKLGGAAAGGSIWDKKEPDSGLNFLNQDSTKNSTNNNNNFSDKKLDSGLSFLNNKEDTAKPSFKINTEEEEEKKPKRMKMGEKKPEEKKKLLDNVEGNDFFEDLDI